MISKVIIDSLDIKAQSPPMDGDCDLLEKFTWEVCKKAVKEHRRPLILELGSWKGYTTAHIASVAKVSGGFVYAVDHFQGNPGVPNAIVAQQQDIFSIFNYNMKALGLSNYVEVLKMTTSEAVKLFDNGELDMIFIDADHSYQAFKNDLLHWRPKVRKGGIFCGHDADMYYHKLSRVQQEIVKSKLSPVDDWCGFCHPGIAYALYEVLNDKYKKYKGSCIWRAK